MSFADSKQVREFAATLLLQTNKVSKWIALGLGFMTMVVAGLLLGGVIVADLSTDSGAPLSPYLALVIVSAGLLLFFYIFVLIVLLFVSGVRLLISYAHGQ